MAVDYASALMRRRPKEAKFVQDDDELEDVLKNRRHVEQDDPTERTLDTLDFVNALSGNTTPRSRSNSGNSFSLSDAKRGYDIYNQASGQPSLVDRLFGGGGDGLVTQGSSTGPASGPIAAPAASTGLAFNGAGYGTATGGAASQAGVAPVAGGLSNAPVAGAGAGGSSLLGALGPLSIMGLAAYLGYVSGEAEGDKYDAKAADPDVQYSRAFFERHPEALTNEGIPADVDIQPGTAPWGGLGNYRYNPDTRRLEHMDSGVSWADALRRDELLAQLDAGD